MKTYHPDQLHPLPRVAPTEELADHLPVNGRALGFANLLFFLAQGSTPQERTSATSLGSLAASGNIVQR